MTVGRSGDREYTIVVMQHQAEARIIGSDVLIRDMARATGRAFLTLPCRECRADCWVAPESLNAAQPRPWPVCLGCFGRALERFDNMDDEAREHGRRLSEVYKETLRQRREPAR
jgi:hypothetical protein